MRIIPVLDVLKGRVVRGIAGQRDSYQPIQSTLTPNSDVRSVCTAFRQQFGISEYYIADLDGIERGKPNYVALTSVKDKLKRVWLDAGFSSVARLDAFDKYLPVNQLHRIIVGLECCSGLSNLALLLRKVGSRRLVFSLDLQNGSPLLSTDVSADWRQATAWEIAEQVIDLGIKKMIVLDLAAVGTGQGTPTLELCGALKQKYPQLEIITGGGVNSAEDLARLEWCCDAALIASAIHDGRLTVDDLKPYQ